MQYFFTIKPFQKMKPIACFFVAFLLLSWLSVSAQRVGLIGGLNLAKVSIEEDGTSFTDQLEYNEAFHLGIIIEIPITDVILVEPGVIGTIKGFRYEEDMGSDPYISRLYLAYVEIPANLKARLPLGIVKPYIEAGPYFAVGVYGRTWVTYGNDDESDEIEWGGDTGEFKRPDFGFNFGAGVELGRVIIGGSYGLGLANISNFEDSTIKNRVIRVILGVKFG